MPDVKTEEFGLPINFTKYVRYFVNVGRKPLIPPRKSLNRNF